MATTKTMTVEDILTELALLRQQVATSNDPLLRSNATASVDIISAAVEALPRIQGHPEFLQEDYLVAREFVKVEWQMRRAMKDKYPSKEGYWQGRIQNAKAAGTALGNLADALGLKVPDAIASKRPEPQQAQLISVPSREVAA